MCEFYFLCLLLLGVFLFFFFKQKTAYEMRISDWSSDVCSSDLVSVAITAQPVHYGYWPSTRYYAPLPRYYGHRYYAPAPYYYEIGRASCRERVCQYV